MTMKYMRTLSTSIHDMFKTNVVRFMIVDTDVKNALGVMFFDRRACKAFIRKSESFGICTSEMKKIGIRTTNYGRLKAEFNKRFESDDMYYVVAHIVTDDDISGSRSASGMARKAGRK